MRLRPRLDELGGPLPEPGIGTVAAVDRLLRVGSAAATASAGPRFFHFVTGGATPGRPGRRLDGGAARPERRRAGILGRSHEVETVVLDWLRRCSGCPRAGVGRWSPAPPSPTSPVGWPRTGGASGTGRTPSPGSPDCRGCRYWPAGTSTRAPARRCSCSATAATRSRCSPATASAGSTWTPCAAARELGGAPAVLLATAGEPNAGAFDPLVDLADLAEGYGAWLHVDGAFGLFAALSPRSAHLTGHGRAARSPPTATSGSTCRTRAGSPWSGGRLGWVRRSACRGRRTSRARTIPAVATCCSAPSRPGGRARCRSGRPSRRTGGKVTGPWSSATSTWPGTSPRRSTPSPTWNAWPRCHSTLSASGTARTASDQDLDEVNRAYGLLFDDGRVFAGNCLQWTGCAAAGGQQLADHRGRPRPVGRRGPRAGRRDRQRHLITPGSRDARLDWVSSTFISMGDDPVAMQRFAEVAAPELRDRVASVRG